MTISEEQRARQQMRENAQRYRDLQSRYQKWAKEQGVPEAERRDDERRLETLADELEELAEQ